MNSQSSWIRGSLIVALIVGLLVVPDAIAGGKRGGGHAGGGARRPPRMSAAHRANRAPAHKAPQMSRAKTPARANTNVARSNNVQPRMNNSQARANTANARSSTAQGRVNNATTGVNGTSLTAATAANVSPNTYRYGSGKNARSYQAHGYGRGYRNHYSGGRSGYGQSQGNMRGVVSRLRSVHKTLTRIDHDYQGHRAKAVHHISMAIRSLSHRSTSSNSNRFMNGGNNVLGTAMNTGRNGVNGNAGANGRNGVNGVNGQNRNAGANGQRNQRMTQAQSDSRMSQALRTTQGIAMQMSHQGTSSSSSHSRAHGHLQRAMHEMNVALNVR